MPYKYPIRFFEPRRGRRWIEYRAWALLERCRCQLNLAALPLPIPVDDWIESPLDIRFGIADLSHLGPDVLGASYLTEREILIDQSLLGNEGRYRFTCAHELGHFVLHAKDASKLADTLPLSNAGPLRERHADRFAAAFLMPLPLVENEFLRIAQARSMQPAQLAIQLMRSDENAERLWRRTMIPALAERFGLSWSATVLRCQDVQPRVPDPQPLLPRSIRDRLLHRDA